MKLQKKEIYMNFNIFAKKNQKSLYISRNDAPGLSIAPALLEVGPVSLVLFPTRGRISTADATLTREYSSKYRENNVVL